jgi:UDP-N-acetylmuramate: L-alanyl-gamma-D-glutamyl-meso-diaminopimelate ligase
MRIHFIAIGGAVMHNLAIALHNKGNIVTGSDDEIFEPSRSRLLNAGLLPAKQGWNADLISSQIDVLILGMHAREDNPELIKARELGLDIKSFPEFLYRETKNKLRIVIGGSHGKTTITSMIMHVLKTSGVKFDYMVGSIVEGFDTMVGLDDESGIAVFEGDEYLTSTLDRRPKFHLYKPDIAVISGIAWDHINVFPDFDTYLEQFRIFADKISMGGTLVYFKDDEKVSSIAVNSRSDIRKIPYSVHKYLTGPGGCTIKYNNREYHLRIFGEHNMENLNAAKKVCECIGIKGKDFMEAISQFRGSARRLELLRKNKSAALFLDFAHAPSKVRASVSALAERYPDHKKICCFELHTFSSLNPLFLKEYKDCLKEADIGYVYYNPEVLLHKKLNPLSKEYVAEAFGSGLTRVFDNSRDLISELKEEKPDRVVYLFMSSGNFNGTDFNKLSENLITEDY